MTPNPVFQISGATYRLVSSFDKPDRFPQSAPVAQRCRSLLMDLRRPTVHWVDNRHYLADGRWRSLTLEHSRQRLNELRSRKTNDTCVVVGNGPSLRNTDLSLLEGQDVFISNYAVIDRRLLSAAKYLGVTNPYVAEQDSERFNSLRGLVKFHPYWLRFCLDESEDTVFLNELPGEPFFSTDVSIKVSGHSTVTHFNLQIAYSLGYRKVILIGCDNHYIQAPGSREGEILTCGADDPNHFDPDYFKGKRWQAADTRLMTQVYGLAKEAFEDAGREIVNCTVGGSLDVFRRGDLKEEVSRPPKTDPSVLFTSPRAKEQSNIEPSSTSFHFFKSRHRGAACRIIFDAPPLPSPLCYEGGDIISVDQRDLGTESPCVLPRYLMMTDDSLIRTLAPDLRLLSCTKFIFPPSPKTEITEDALTCLMDKSLLPEMSDCAPLLASATTSKQTYAVGLAIYLGYSTIGLPREVVASLREKGNRTLEALLIKHQVTVSVI